MCDFRFETELKNNEKNKKDKIDIFFSESSQNKYCDNKKLNSNQQNSDQNVQSDLIFSSLLLFSLSLSSWSSSQEDIKINDNNQNIDENNKNISELIDKIIIVSSFISFSNKFDELVILIFLNLNFFDEVSTQSHDKQFFDKLHDLFNKVSKKRLNY